jgi:MarR family transcriptional regulator for hemolysin
MQLLSPASNSRGADEACANAVLDTVPMVMRVIRQHLRRHRSGLTVPQFRTLCNVSTGSGLSLSAVADFIGLSLPAMSRLVDGLVEKRLLTRKTCDEDRRHVRLSITPRGEATLREARDLARKHLAEALAGLPASQRAGVETTMRILRGLFSGDLTAEEGTDAAPAAKR